MPQAWEITTTDERSEDQITTFIIFCEDQNDEPIYFRSFQIANKLKINCIPNQKKAKINLLNTLSACLNDGLMDCINNIYQIKKDVTENIWCVYDRDLEDINLLNIKQMHELDFTTAITMATQSGLKVAWSNDAFELWVLLHFEQVPIGNKFHRNYIYERLTEILKVNPSVCEAYSDLIDNNVFNYKTHLKRRQAFLTYIVPILKSKTSIAIENAIILEKNYNGNIPYHDWNPCTMVHRLVKDILDT